MSRSQPTNNQQNPSTRWFEWAGGKGQIKWFDKEAKQNNFIDPKKAPFLFLVLDQLSTVTGFSDALQGGYWANEIRSTQTDTLKIRSKKGIEFEGLYDKTRLPQGAKFTASVYIAYKDEEGNLKLGNIKFSGAAISAWIEFVKTINVNTAAVAITGSVSGKKGAVEFESPTFQAVEVDAKTDAEALKLDEELQVYLESYLKTKGAVRTQVQPDEHPTEDAGPDVEIRDLDAGKNAPGTPGPEFGQQSNAPAPAATPAAPAGGVDLNKIKF